MGSVFGSKKTSTSQSHSTTNESGSTTPFTGGMADQYGDTLSLAKANATNQINNTNQIIANGGYKADTSKMDSGYYGMLGMDNSNINKINSMSINPNENADWVKAQDTIDANTMRNFGAVQDQVNRNIIGSGMANGSGHQSAMYRAGADFTSQLGADRANRWQAQYNQNINNVSQANQQLQTFYKTLEGMGVDYAGMSQQDLDALFSAYTAQNNAISNLGGIVEMGSNPTVTATSTTDAKGKNTESSSGLGSIVGTALGAYLGAK